MTDSPPTEPIPPKSTSRRIVRLLIPASIGATSLVIGLYLAQGWTEITLLQRIAAAALLLLGAVTLTTLAAILLILYLLRRFFRGLKRDAKSLAYSAKYMIRQGKMRD